MLLFTRSRKAAKPRRRSTYLKTSDELNLISRDIVNLALRIHVKLGPGMLESVYEMVLARDLTRQGFQVERQKAISFDFEGLWFDDAFRVDLVVERCIAIEIKSVETLGKAHEKQLLTYLKLLDFRLGFLLNFGAPMMKDGIKRLVHRL